MLKELVEKKNRINTQTIEHYRNARSARVCHDARITELHGRYMQCCRPVKKALSPPRYSNKIKNKIKHDDEFKSRIMFR